MKTKIMQKEPLLAIGYLIIVMICGVRIVTRQRIRLPLIMVGVLSILAVLSVHVILSMLMASSMSPGQTRNEVRMTMTGYDPSYLTIKKGTKVIFNNVDEMPHTATDVGIFDTDIIPKHQILGITFNNVGEFKYYCLIHPFMHGTIKVTT